VRAPEPRAAPDRIIHRACAVRWLVPVWSVVAGASCNLLRPCPVCPLRSIRVIGQPSYASHWLHHGCVCVVSRVAHRLMARNETERPQLHPESIKQGTSQLHPSCLWSPGPGGPFSMHLQPALLRTDCAPSALPQASGLFSLGLGLRGVEHDRCHDSGDTQGHARRW